MKHHFRSVVLISLLPLLLTFTSPVVAQEAVYYPTTSWRTSSPEAQGMDSETLGLLLDRIATVPDSLHSIMLIRHGYIVLDASMYPFSSSKPQAFREGAEAVMATLIGIAIDKGYIKGVDQSIWDFLPKDQTANMDENKAALTVEDFLTHSSGLALVAGEDYKQYYPLSGKESSWLQVILDTEVTSKPKESTRIYGDGLVLSAVLQEATGMTALDFARQHLFAPLGITDVAWLADQQGVTIGFDEIYLSPQDMAKMAYLYLHNGQWEGQQLVSERWVQAATSEIMGFWSSAHHRTEAFGYGWIISGEGDNRFFYQITAGGEQFGVFPELDLVYMVTGDTYGVFSAEQNSTLQSVGMTAALPENANALDQLNSKVEALVNPTLVDVTTLPEVYRAVSGKTYQLEANRAGWTSLAIDFGVPGSKEGTLTLGINDSTVKLNLGVDFVPRITPVGLPAQPASVAYRLLGDLPWMARTTWTSKGLMVYLSDLMGRETWGLILKFPAENQMKAAAVMHGLESNPGTWFFNGTAS